MKKYTNLYTFTQETYKISKKTIEKYMKNYTKKLKYFITWHIKPKIQWKISLKKIQNVALIH